jgi:GNAT superfamily N-acetyltransferase
VNTSSVSVALSAIDEERFGVRTARANRVTASSLPEILAFCEANGVELLIARCAATEIRTVQTLEAHGCLLMDTLVYFVRDLTAKPIPPDTGAVPVRAFHPGDEAGVRAVARAAFRGYGGHYHADPRLDPAKCDEAYVSWADRSCLSPGVADAVLVAASEDEIAGFATLRLNNTDEGEFVLAGVSPAFHGHGIYRSLTIRCMEWCLAHGARTMVISTQLTNVAVQRVWTRLGLEPRNAYYTLHKWFSR